jgi:hypothetical protein
MTTTPEALEDRNQYISEASERRRAEEAKAGQLADQVEAFFSDDGERVRTVLQTAGSHIINTYLESAAADPDFASRESAEHRADEASAKDSAEYVEAWAGVLFDRRDSEAVQLVKEHSSSIFSGYLHNTERPTVDDIVSLDRKVENEAERLQFLQEKLDDVRAKVASNDLAQIMTIEIRGPKNGEIGEMIAGTEQFLREAIAKLVGQQYLRLHVLASILDGQPTEELKQLLSEPTEIETPDLLDQDEIAGELGLGSAPA